MSAQEKVQVFFGVMGELINMGYGINKQLLQAVEQVDNHAESFEKLQALLARSEKINEEYHKFKADFEAGKFISLIKLENIKNDMQQLLVDTVKALNSPTS